ncbi:hypothetical protein R3W88_029946 [Solanum pinnatisectum]|uniref:Uncharacterized protein n=1 Tax=Solanum pinnatisectum TaxID=50273 RepID=A0AAV9K6R1_9SOLN|nr:hypothetical protein R3W88_029946 [Solanum pinnatisectum]
MVTFCFQPILFSIIANLIFVVAARNYPTNMSSSFPLPPNVCTLLQYHLHLLFDTPPLSSLPSVLPCVRKLLPLTTPLLSSSSPLPSYVLESSHLQPLIQLPSSRIVQQVPSYDLEISLLQYLMVKLFLLKILLLFVAIIDICD